jgi:two-component system cell cycle response regulator
MDRFRIALVAFTPITTTLFKTTLVMMGKRGHPVVLHDGVGKPDLYLIDTDNEDTLDIWRQEHLILDAPLLFIGKKSYDFSDILVLAKPLKWDLLVQSILSTLKKSPPTATPRWKVGYKEELPPVVNPLQKLARPKALVIDDSATIRYYLGVKLSSFNIDIDHAESAEVAFGMVNNSEYLCIFLDVMMPGMDGYEACKYLRREMNITIPIVMVTSRDSPFDKMRGQISGSTDYLVKPIDDMSFNTTMRRVLQRSRRV